MRTGRTQTKGKRHAMINQKMKEYGTNRSVIRDLFEFGLKKKAEIGEENVYDFSLGNPNVDAPDEV